MAATGARPLLAGKDAAGAPGDCITGEDTTGAVDRLSFMLGRRRWPPGAKFDSVVGLIKCDLAQRLLDVGFRILPSSEILGRLCEVMVGALPRQGNLPPLNSLLPGKYIDTSVSDWLRETLSGHAGFAVRVPGCAPEGSPIAERCLLRMNRKECIEQQKIALSIEAFNLMEKAYNDCENFQKRDPQGRGIPSKRVDLSQNDERGDSGEPVLLDPPLPPSLQTILPKSWRRYSEAVSNGARICYVIMSDDHASAGIIDASKNPAVCKRLCSLNNDWTRQEKRYVRHLLEPAEREVHWARADTAPQRAGDCQIRAALAQIEFMLGTQRGTSSEDADPSTVHEDMQIVRAWCILRLAEESQVGDLLLHAIQSAVSQNPILFAIEAEPGAPDGQTMVCNTAKRQIAELIGHYERAVPKVGPLERRMTRDSNASGLVTRKKLRWRMSLAATSDDEARKIMRQYLDQMIAAAQIYRPDLTPEKDHVLFPIIRGILKWILQSGIGDVVYGPEERGALRSNVSNLLQDVTSNEELGGTVVPNGHTRTETVVGTQTLMQPPAVADGGVKTVKTVTGFLSRCARSLSWPCSSVW